MPVYRQDLWLSKNKALAARDVQMKFSSEMGVIFFISDNKVPKEKIKTDNEKEEQLSTDISKEQDSSHEQSELVFRDVDSQRDFFQCDLCG